jgi:ornithine racemase
MNRVVIDLGVMKHNIEVVDRWMTSHGASWTLVTKCLCGHADTLLGLQMLGVRSIGDSRLENLHAMERAGTNFETWYLRLPHLTAIPDIVRLSDVTLNSEMRVIEAISAEAQRLDKLHRIIVMIELGDLREGILPGSLTDFYNHVFGLPNVKVQGIGANLGCLSGSVPNVDQLMQLVLYRELLELKFERPMPMISAGSSAVLPLLLQGSLPKPINHFRIGEAVFLGSDLIHGGSLKALRNDAIYLEADIVEIKEKNLIALGESTAHTPFEPIEQQDSSHEPGQRGYRAVISVGQLDTEVKGLLPLNPLHHIAGASSDLSVVNVGENPGGLKVGDNIKFRLNYAALVRAMSSPYIEKVHLTPLKDFGASVGSNASELVPPVIEQTADGDRANTSASSVR